MRFKNLLGHAEDRLIEQGLRSPEARDLMAPAHELFLDETFWETLLDGLAVFISPSLFRAYSVSTPLREFLEVGDCFYIKPLLPVLQSDARFHLLTLSQDRVALFEGSRESLVEAAVPDLPRDLSSALHVENFPPERHLEFRSQGPKAGKQGLIFHGHSEEAEDVSRFLLDYFHQVNRAVTTFLRNDRSPLLVAGVDYLHPLYAEVNTYPHLLRGGVYGNPDVFNVADLHRRAWGVVEAALNLELDRAIAEYADSAGGPRSSEEVSTILVGASFGRVGRLFVAEDVTLWGRLDLQSLAVTVHDRREPGDVDLLDWAASRVLSTDGVVHALPRARVPGGGPMAALFRF